MKIVISGMLNIKSEIDGAEKNYEDKVDLVVMKSECNDRVFSDVSDGSSGLIDLNLSTDSFNITIRCSSDEIKNAMKIMET